MVENKTTLEGTLCKKLSELIFDGEGGIDAFITNALGGDNGIAEIQKAAANLKGKGEVDHRTLVGKQKEVLKKLIEQLDPAYIDKTYHYREAAGNIEKNIEEIKRSGKLILLQSLKEELEKYVNLVNAQADDEEKIYKRMIKFQQFIAQGLSLDIVFVHTSGEKASAKKYSRAIELDESILKLLTFESDQKVSLSLGGSGDTKNLANIVKEAINEEFKNEVQKQDKLLKAVKNEERTYNEIKENRFKTFSNKKKRIAWVINKGERHYWQTERVSNMGPIEEARQRILFQIHLEDVWKLFSSDLTEPISGEIQTEGIGEAGTPKDEKLEIWIHHFVRSKLGIAGTDTRPGVIIDDTLLETKNLLNGVKDWLGIEEGEGRKYVSIASKTDNPNFAGYTPFLTFINKLTKYKKNKKDKDRKNLENYLKKRFFDDGARMTGIVNDIGVKELNKTFSNILTTRLKGVKLANLKTLTLTK